MRVQAILENFGSTCNPSVYVAPNQTAPDENAWRPDTLWWGGVCFASCWGLDYQRLPGAAPMPADAWSGFRHGRARRGTRAAGSFCRSGSPGSLCSRACRLALTVTLCCPGAQEGQRCRVEFPPLPAADPAEPLSCVLGLIVHPSVSVDSTSDPVLCWPAFSAGPQSSGSS